MKCVLENMFSIMVVLYSVFCLCDSRSSRRNKKRQDPCDDCSTLLQGNYLDICKDKCRPQYEQYVRLRCGDDHIIDSVVGTCEPCSLTCHASEEEFKEISIYSEEDCAVFCGRAIRSKKPEAEAHISSDPIVVRMDPPYDDERDDEEGSAQGVGSGMGSSGYNPNVNTKARDKSHTSDSSDYDLNKDIYIEEYDGTEEHNAVEHTSSKACSRCTLLSYVVFLLPIGVMTIFIT